MFKSLAIATSICRLTTCWWVKKIGGVENIPPLPAPLIFAANHSSLADGVLLCAEINWRRRVPTHPIVTQEPFAHWLFGWILRSTKAIALDRKNPASIKQALQFALGYLQAGEPLVIFPEGHLNDGKSLRLPRAGLALLALNSNAQIIPCGLRGTPIAFPRGQKPRLKKCVELHFGKPLNPLELREKYRGGNDDERKNAIDKLSYQVMSEISALSGMQLHRRMKIPV